MLPWRIKTYLLLVVVEVGVVVEAVEGAVGRRELERLVAEVEPALLEGHEARRGEETVAGQGERTI